MSELALILHSFRQFTSNFIIQRPLPALVRICSVDLGFNVAQEVWGLAAALEKQGIPIYRFLWSLYQLSYLL
jgi:hypothetical protein